FTKIIEPGNPVLGVGEGVMATNDIPIGPRYHVIWILATVTRTGTAPVLADAIDLINVKVNGKIQRSFTATELDAINTLMDPDCQARYRVGTGALGLGAIVAGNTVTWYLPIFLAEPWRKSYAAQEALAWPTVGKGWQLQSLQLEINVAADGDATRSNQAVSVYLEKDAGVGADFLNLTKWYRNNAPYAAAGDLIINTLRTRGVVQQVNLFNVQSSGGTNTDVISSCRVKVNGLTVRDVTKSANDAGIISRSMNSAGLATTRFDIVYDYDDIPSNGLVLNGTEDYQVIPNLSAAANTSKQITVISQSYGPPD